MTFEQGLAEIKKSLESEDPVALIEEIHSLAHTPLDTPSQDRNRWALIEAFTWRLAALVMKRKGG